MFFQRDQGFRARSAVSPSLRQFHRNPPRWVDDEPRSGAVSFLWWPRRPLATLGRKSRQGRKAATVSIDAGAEVSRRGYRLFGHRIFFIGCCCDGITVIVAEVSRGAANS